MPKVADTAPIDTDASSRKLMQTTGVDPDAEGSVQSEEEGLATWSNVFFLKKRTMDPPSRPGTPARARVRRARVPPVVAPYSAGPGGSHRKQGALDRD